MAMVESASTDTVITNRGARLVLSLVQTPGGWDVQFHGAQIDLGLERGADRGTATVHLEQNGHAGISLPPFASAHEVARAASDLLARVAPTIPQDAGARAPALLSDAAARIAAQVPPE